MFSDRERVQTMMQLVGGFDNGSDLHNKLYSLAMLLNRDVPALLDVLDQLAARP
jgi:hypothetical protein